MEFPILSFITYQTVGVLHNIIQNCWTLGAILKIWKSAIIIPLLKSGKPRAEIGSYRPIALTSHVGKLMERIILNRLLYYCEKNKIIPSNQASFRSGHGTTDHLVKTPVC